MKPFAIIALATLAAGCTATAGDPPAEMSADAADRLTEELRGYAAAGPPISCVNQRELRGNRSVGDAILFGGRGNKLIYVNRPAGGCPELRFNRALITRTTSTQLCRGDIATVFDPTSRTEYGSCGLGDFQPYRRAAR